MQQRTTPVIGWKSTIILVYTLQLSCMMNILHFNDLIPSVKSHASNLYIIVIIVILYLFIYLFIYVGKGDMRAS